MSRDSERRTLRDAAGAARFLSPVYGLLERALNDALRYDPATRQQLAEHKGRVLAVECLRPPVSAYFLFTAEGVEIYDACETTVDAAIRAGALGLLRQLAAEHPEVAPAGGDVQVSGDTRFVQDIVRIARDIDVDWEEPLARIVGDVAARQVGELVRGFAGFLKRTATSLRHDGEDYLRYELDLLPSRLAVREFLRDIDDLRFDADRVEARFDALRRRLDALDGKRKGEGRHA